MTFVRHGKHTAIEFQTVFVSQRGRSQGRRENQAGHTNYIYAYVTTGHYERRQGKQASHSKFNKTCVTTCRCQGRQEKQGSHHNSIISNVTMFLFAQGR